MEEDVVSEQLELQRQFAMQMMEIEEPKKKKVVVIVKRKPEPIETKRAVRKVYRLKQPVKSLDEQRAEDAQLALSLDAWNEKTEIHNKRKELFTLDFKWSLGSVLNPEEANMTQEELEVKERIKFREFCKKEESKLGEFKKQFELTDEYENRIKDMPYWEVLPTWKMKPGMNVRSYWDEKDWEDHN